MIAAGLLVDMALSVAILIALAFVTRERRSTVRIAARATGCPTVSIGGRKVDVASVQIEARSLPYGAPRVTIVLLPHQVEFDGGPP